MCCIQSICEDKNVAPLKKKKTGITLHPRSIPITAITSLLLTMLLWPLSSILNWLLWMWRGSTVICWLFYYALNLVSVHEASLQEQKLRGELRKQNIPASSLATVRIRRDAWCVTRSVSGTRKNEPCLLTRFNRGSCVKPHFYKVRVTLTVREGKTWQRW